MMPPATSAAPAELFELETGAPALVERLVYEEPLAYDEDDEVDDDDDDDVVDEDVNDEDDDEESADDSD